MSQSECRREYRAWAVGLEAHRMELVLISGAVNGRGYSGKEGESLGR